jgi:hypothetical protein
MKKKTINKILNRVFEAYTESIKDDKVKTLVQQNTIITGGCIASMLLNEEVNDYDLYFSNKETVLAVANYYVDLFNKNNDKNKIPLSVKEIEEESIQIIAKSAGIVSESQDGEDYQYFEQLDPGSPEQEKFIDDAIVATKVYGNKKEKYRPVFITTNAITLSNSIQLILRFYGDPEEIHRNYDFVHCTNYWTSKNKEVVLRPEALETLLTKELVYVGSKYPICSVIRLRKFIKKGWTINAGQILKMAFQIKELDLYDPKVLADQLIGVDVAYFVQLLHMIYIDNRDIDYIYICELIDKIF